MTTLFCDTDITDSLKGRMEAQMRSFGAKFPKVHERKKAGTKKLARLQCWLVARIKIVLNAEHNFIGTKL